MKFKKILSIILVGIMSLSSFSNVVMAEDESGYDDIQLFSTTYSLDDLKGMLPAGTYWNHKYKITDELKETSSGSGKYKLYHDKNGDYDKNGTSYHSVWKRTDFKTTQYKYRDRSKVYTYYYKKSENKESTSYPSGDNISNIQEWVTYKYKTFTLDLNGMLDNSYSSGISNFGTADIYINGVQVANDVTDFYQTYSYGTSYEIKDIKPLTGHSYDGINSGNLSGTITDNISVVLKFHTNSYIRNVISEDETKGTVTGGGTYLYGTNAEIKAFPKQGYIFSQWSNGSTSSAITITVTGNATYTAYFSPQKYQVTFDPNTGTVDVTDKTITYNELYGELPIPQKNGYKFDGWFTAVTGGIKIDASTKVSTLSNQTLYAQWSEVAHNFSEWIVDKKPSCTEVGLQHRTCIDCGTVEQTEVATTEHTYSEKFVVVEIPTCTKEGKQAYVVRKYVNNAWVDVATTTNTYYDDKNLTAGNSYKYYVQVRDGSNNYLTSTFSASAVLEILPTKISLDKTAITLTEGESANLTYTISPNNVTNKNVTWTSSNSSVATVSGGTVKAVSEGIANITVTTTNGKSAQCSITVKSKKCSHQYGEWITEATANCETDGSRYRTCSKCGEKETETIPALGHSYSSEWTVITPESCTENGEMAHICLTCGGKTDITPIPATEHQFNDEWLTEKSATCLEEGIEYRQCANCDVKETRTTEKTTHNYVLTDEIDMTQDAPGYKTYTCSICNDSYTEEYVPEINAGIIEIGSGAPQVGGTVTLPVTISQNPGIAGFLFTLNYDKTALVPKTITKGEILTAGTFTSNLEQGIPAEQLSEISVYWENDKNMTSNGVLFNITFEVKASAEEGEYPVSLNYEKGDITDETMDDVMPDLLGNTVTIADVLRGDVNLDRQVNILDSILLSRYIAKWDVTFDEKQKQAANVFMDSRINSKDGVRLSQILSGYDITESVALLSTNEINLEVGNVEASGGEYVSVPVTISENEGIAGFNFKIEYDKNVLTPVSVTKGDALLDGSFMTNLTEDTDGSELDYVTAYWNNSYNVTDNGELFNVEFLVNENAEIGNTLPITLTYEADDLCDNNLNDVTGNITNGSVTVTSSNATVEADGDISLGYVITDLTMQSETGVTYEDIPQKGDFDLIAEIDGIYSEINDILPSKFIVALYDENDMFIKLETKDITEQMITDGKVEISVGKTSKAIAKLKLFIWNSLDSMKPLAESVIMPEIME